MVIRRKWVILTLVFLAAIGLPYIFAALTSGKDYVFNGFLLNMGDSNSYLAKMYEGWNGSWQFTLPYTADPGQGGYINLLYLFLGHLAYWLNLPLLIVFHAARIISATLMLAALAKFLITFLGSEQTAWTAAVWTAFGSGLGWVLLLFGVLAADTWVVDAYPFLSAFVIPHFALSLAIMLWLFSRSWSSKTHSYVELGSASISWRTVLSDVLAALFLSLISPFSVVIVLVVLGGDCLLSLWIFRRRYWQDKDWLRLFWITLGGAPMLLYQVWLTRVDPIFAIWNAQNVTPSPAPWDLVASFSPAFLLAVLGGIAVIRGIKASNGSIPIANTVWLKSRLLFVWAILGLGLLYVPFDLQRRFILGLYVPIVGLAVIGLEQFNKRKAIIQRIGLTLSLPTNVFILAMTILGSLTHAPVLYLTQDEAAAMNWIKSNTPVSALVLASSDTGMFIPADTSRRVLYGHQYETVNADQEKRIVDDFFSDQMTITEANSLLRTVDVVFCGPREQLLSKNTSCPHVSGLSILFQHGQVTLYAGEK